MFLCAVTEASSLYIIVIYTSTTECRLMIDPRAAHEAFDQRDIRGIGWISRSRNVSDASTTEVPYQAILDLLRSPFQYNKVLYWVLWDATIHQTTRHQ